MTRKITITIPIDLLTTVDRALGETRRRDHMPQLTRSDFICRIVGRALVDGQQTADGHPADIPRPPGGRPRAVQQTANDLAMMGHQTATRRLAAIHQTASSHPPDGQQTASSHPTHARSDTDRSKNQTHTDQAQTPAGHLVAAYRRRYDPDRVGRFLRMIAPDDNPEIQRAALQHAAGYELDRAQCAMDLTLEKNPGAPLPYFRSVINGLKAVQIATWKKQTAGAAPPRPVTDKGPTRIGDSPALKQYAQQEAERTAKEARRQEAEERDRKIREAFDAAPEAVKNAIDAEAREEIEKLKAVTGLNVPPQVLEAKILTIAARRLEVTT